MRIVHAFKDVWPPVRGGVEQHIHDVVSSLTGFEFVVLTSSRSRRLIDEEADGVRVVRAPELARPASTALTPSWPRLLRKLHPDLLHVHMPNPLGELLLLPTTSRVPTIATYHADPAGRPILGRLYRPVQQRFLRRAHRVLVSSPVLADTSSSLSSHRDRLEVLPFGVDVETWGRRPTLADDLRHRYPGPLILFLGRLRAYKGLEVLLEAMPQLDATLLMVGDGPALARLRARAGQLGLGHRVTFIGEVSDEDRAAYYHAADVFVLPSTSRAESFGIAMMEAMACGLPAISTELGTGTSWVNIDGETGTVVPPGDPSALAAAADRLLSDEGLRRRMGEAAADRVRRKFSRRAMLQGLAEIYESVRPR